MSEAGASGDDATHAVTIRFPQVDPAGIVFYPRYFEMVQRAFPTVPFTSLPCGVKTQFLRPNRFGDRIELRYERGESTADWSVTGNMAGDRYFSMTPLEAGDAEASYSVSTSARFATAETVVGDWCAGAAGQLQLSRYFELLNMAIEEWFESVLDLPFAELHVARRIGIPTVQFDTRIHSLPRLDDKIAIRIQVVNLGRRAMTFTSWLVGDDQCHVSNEQVIVFVRMLDDGFESIDIPDAIRAAFQQQMDEAHVAT